MFACRDLDSSLNAREVAAVQEWRENSSEPIHAMRDHPDHGGWGMVGACWDTDLTRKNSRTKWAEAWHKMLKDPITYAGRDAKGPDQTILHRFVMDYI